MSMPILFVLSMSIGFENSSAANPGPHKTGVVTITFEDASRANRKLITEIWYPTDDTRGDEKEFYPRTDVLSRSKRDAMPKAGKYPVIVFSHGLTGAREQCIFITEHLASHGYLVISPDHQFNTRRDFDPQKVYQSGMDRPKDISFVLDRLKEVCDSDRPGWKGLADFDRIGMCGHSFGGYTTLAVAGAKVNTKKMPAKVREGLKIPEGYISSKDSRVKAAIAYAPAFKIAYDEKSLEELDIPLMILGGTVDVLTPFETDQVTPFEYAHNTRYLVRINGAAHNTFANEEMVISGGPMSKMIYKPTITRDRSDPEILSLTLAFWDKYLVGKDRYAECLEERTSKDVVIRYRKAGDKTPIESELKVKPKKEIPAPVGAAGN